MQWFKKWWQEKYGNRSNKEDGTYRGGNKCIKRSSSQQSINDSKSRITLSRESICESSDKTARALSSESSSSSSSSSSVQSNNNNHTNQKSIQSAPIACRLRQQAKDLESIISGSVSSNHSINVENDSAASSVPELLDPDDFFENPDDIRPYKEENAFIDEYIIVDIKEVEAITQQQPPPTQPATSNKNPKRVRYQTTEFVIKSAKVKNHPPIISMTSYCNDGYGLFYGTPSFSLSQFPETFYYRTFDENVLYGCNYVGPKKKRYKRADEKPTSSRKVNSSAETLEGKVDAFEKSLMGPLINELPKPSNDNVSIQKTFGLTDDGDIIINVDHIMEEKGCGFLLTRKISIYRSVEEGDAICEKRHIRRSILAILKEFFYQLCKCLT